MTSPVTLIAETAVKNASMRLAPPGPTFENGSISKPVPMIMTKANPMKIMRAGCSRGPRLSRLGAT